MIVTTTPMTRPSLLAGSSASHAAYPAPLTGARLRALPPVDASGAVAVAPAGGRLTGSAAPGSAAPAFPVPGYAAPGFPAPGFAVPGLPAPAQHRTDDTTLGILRPGRPSS